MGFSWRIGRVLFSVIACLTFCGTLLAQTTFTFANLSTTWGSTTTNNWGAGTGVKPGSNSLTTNNDIALISNTGTVTLNINFGATGNGVGTPYYLGGIDYAPNTGTNVWTFGSNAGTVGTLNLNASTLNSQTNVYLYSRSASTSTWNIQSTNSGGTGAMSIGLRTAAGRIITNANNTINLSALVTGTGGFVKEGAGNLTLGNASNSYQGKTSITGGRLSINNSSALGQNPVTYTADQITLDGGTLQAITTNVSFSAGNNRGITLGASGGTFDTTSQGISIETTIAGTSGGSLTKIGSATLSLDGANTYDGATNLSEGPLLLYALSGDSTNRLPATTVLTLGTLTTSGTVQLGNNSVNASNPAHQTVAGLATTTGGTTSTNTITSDTTSNAILTINNSANYTFAGTIGGGGTNQNNIDLVKLGNGVQVLSGNNTYTGTTTVNAGTLQVNGTHTGGGTYTVDTGGTLGGNGTINANVNIVTGTLAPGTSPGRLTINGNVAFTNTTSSVYSVEINGGTTAGTDYDQLRVGSGGSLALNGATLTATLGFTPLGTEKIFLTDNLFASPITGQFNNLPEGASVSMGDYVGTISYLGDYSTLSLTGGNDVVIYGLAAAIPEPGTIALLGLTGFFGVQWYLRRKPAVAKKEEVKSEGDPAPVEAIV